MKFGPRLSIHDWTALPSLGTQRMIAIWCGGFTYMARRSQDHKAQTFDAWVIPDSGCQIEVLAETVGPEKLCELVRAHNSKR